MFKRKCLFLAVLIAAVFQPLMGEGQSEEASRRKLVINSPLSDPTPKAAFGVLVEGFKAEHPDIDVTVNTFDQEAYKTAIRNFLVSDAPDLALWFAGNRMKFFVDKGLLADISDLWDRAGFHETMASSRATLTVDGAQYGVPYGYYQWGIFYRKDLFEKAGLGVPETWEEFLQVCGTLKAAGITPITIGTKYLWTAGGWFDYLNLRTNGYDFHMALTEGRISYTDSRLDAVFARWKTLIDREFFLENHATYSWQEAQAPFIKGDAAMYLIGNFIVPDLESAGVADQVGFFPFPRINPELGLYEDAPMNSYHIPAGAKNPEEARLFLEYVARPDIMADFAYAIGTIPPNKDSRPPENRFTKAGFDLLNRADGLAQFYDRDTTPELASAGMQGFQEFMVKPERLSEVRARIDMEREKILK